MPRFIVVLSAWTEMWEICWIVFLFLKIEVFSINSSMGILDFSLNVPLLFSHRIFQYRQMSFFNGIQLHFVCLCILNPVFFAHIDELAL